MLSVKVLLKMVKFTYCVILLSSMLLVACGGGSGGSATPPANSVASSSVATVQKTPYEIWYERWAVTPGIYEVEFESSQGKKTTQARIRLFGDDNSGFLSPIIEICNIGFDSRRDYFAQNLKIINPANQSTEVPGEVYFVQDIGSSKEQTIKLVVDKANPGVLRGRRFNNVSGEEESITMYFVAKGDKYLGGSLSIANTNASKKKVASDNICYSTQLEPVVDSKGNKLGDIEMYFINVLDSESKYQPYSLKGAVDIYYYPENIDLLPAYSMGGAFIYNDPHVSYSLITSPQLRDPQTSDELRTVFKAAELQFSITMKGIPGSESDGEEVTGSVILTKQPTH